jgi:ABC-type Fe3+/spermidine/putrescine transport system ATPase subunit
VTLELAGISHRYGSELAVESVSFGVDSGDLVAVLGPSGCGKTTLVQAIAGHVRPTAGRVRLRGEDVTDRPPETRRVGVVFQQSTLFPHMTVRENVAYGLAPQDLGADRREQRVEQYLDLVALDGRRGAYPGELSGGQQRRVELARALAPHPDLLVLDEPLSALDRTLREQLRAEIARVQRETGVTTLVVTHDQADAMALADSLVVMNDGRVAAAGDPRALYQSPPTLFVASFLGRSNSLDGRVLAEHPPAVAVGGQRLALDGQNETPDVGATVTCHVRPAAVTLADDEIPTLQGEVVRVDDVGRRYDVTIEVGEQRLLAGVSADPPASGESVTVGLPRDAVTVFGSELSRAVTARSS